MPNVLDSASNLRASLLRREFSARDLLGATLAAIERLNPALNTIVQMGAASLGAPRWSPMRVIARGEGRPLEGLPVTIKDCCEVAGMVASVGAPALQHYIPKKDASAVARLRGAGAIILGQDHVPLLTGDFQSYNGLYGTTNNPWNLEFSPGGSSGGAAVAIATGMSALEIGSDLAGSIRWPAHCCGIFGLKTTWNIVSTYGHIRPMPDMRLARNPELLVAGPLARSPADLALVLDVLAGPRDPAMPARPLPPARQTSPKGLRVALWLDSLSLRSTQRWRTPCARPRSCWKKPERSWIPPRARRFPSRKPGRSARFSSMHSLASACLKKYVSGSPPGNTIF
jgi:amidase